MSRVLTGLSLLLAAWLGWEFYSGYSLFNPVLHTSVVLGAVLVSGLAWRGVRRTRTERQRLQLRIACLPGLVMGVIPILVTVINLLPALLVLPFVAAELLDLGSRTHHIQRVVSPDGRRVADVTYISPALVVQSLGSLEIDVTYQWNNMPIVGRTISIYISDSAAPTQPTAYLHWQTSDTLYVPSTHSVIPV